MTKKRLKCWSARGVLALMLTGVVVGSFFIPVTVDSSLLWSKAPHSSLGALTSAVVFVMVLGFAVLILVIVVIASLWEAATDDC